MVLDVWLNKLGHSVKSAWKKTSTASNKLRRPEKLGVLAFEVRNLMSKTILLWNSLSDPEVIRLRADIINMEGVRRLVSNDDDFLLSLACGEKLDTLSDLAEALGRLGRKCVDPALQGFVHVYQDVLTDSIDVRRLMFSYKTMESKVKKMDKYISYTNSLYQELEVLADLEQTLRRLQNAGTKDGVSTAHQKVVWHRHEVKYLREVSLWTRTFDSVVGLLAQCIFTIYGRIRFVFGSPSFCADNPVTDGSDVFTRSHSLSSPMVCHAEPRFSTSGPLERSSEMNHGKRFGHVLNRLGSHKVWNDRERSSSPQISVDRFVKSPSPGRISTDFSILRHISGNGNSSPSDDGGSEYDYRQSDFGRQSDFTKYDRPARVSVTLPRVSVSCDLKNLAGSVIDSNGVAVTGSFFASKCKLLSAPPSTLGGAALALHYANLIIVIEKLVRFPHLIGPDARDDLYQMLPSSIRTALRAKLKAYSRNMSSTRYNAALAADWNDALGKILEWLGPLAHNMIRWQSERNFEQQHMVPRTNVLLLQTLHFANQAKTELAITELLVGLNYICRYEQEIRTGAMMECSNSHDYDEYLEWQV